MYICIDTHKDIQYNIVSNDNENLNSWIERSMAKLWYIHTVEYTVKWISTYHQSKSLKYNVAWKKQGAEKYI